MEIIWMFNCAYNTNSLLSITHSQKSPVICPDFFVAQITKPLIKELYSICLFV